MIEVYADKKPAGILDYNEDNKEFIFNYKENNPISLTMPYSSKSYISHYNLHPIFDMNMPEGYLFELLKNLLIKEYGKIDDYILFSHLSKNIEGFLTYKEHTTIDNALTLDSLINTTQNDIFSQLVEQFLQNSAIAGVQPKVLVPLYDKATLSTKEYIVKSFSSEFPHLAENEYFCMSALKYAGIKTPKFWLAKNKKLFIMEKFTYQKDSDSFYGFEEFCALFGYNKEKKYKGSYEQIAKAIAQISTQASDDLKEFYKMIVMNYLLKNGDAHLKNFGMLYTTDKEQRFLAPAYDVINTIIYLPKDKPALNLLGKKVWFGKKELIEFGVKNCLLTEKEAKDTLDNSIEAIKKTIKDIEEYISKNSDFKEFGERFTKILNFSIDNLGRSYKDLSNAIF